MRRFTTEERFWQKVTPLSNPEWCWRWQAAIRSDGYGAFSYDGRMRVAHRYAYQLLVGPIPAGLQIDHLCRIRHCVNPAHLEVVTQRVNLFRGDGWPGRQKRQAHCKRGHPFDLPNTYLSKKGERICRTCARARDIARYHRHYYGDLAKSRRQRRDYWERRRALTKSPAL